VETDPRPWYTFIEINVLSPLHYKKIVLHPKIPMHFLQLKNAYPSFNNIPCFNYIFKGMGFCVVWGCDPGQGITRTRLFGGKLKARSSNFLIIVDVGGVGREIVVLGGIHAQFNLD
jgi:hypothetical protein